jgi:hypothetical protein
MRSGVSPPFSSLRLRPSSGDLPGAEYERTAKPARYVMPGGLAAAPRSLAAGGHLERLWAGIW